MLSDDFNTPLGLNKKSRQPWFTRPLTIPLGLPLIGLLILCLAVFAGLALHRRLGGDPIVATPAKPGEQEKPVTQELRGVPDAPTPAAPDDAASATGSVPTKQPAASGPTVTIIDGTTGKRQEIVLPPAMTKPRGPLINAG